MFPKNIALLYKSFQGNEKGPKVKDKIKRSLKDKDHFLSLIKMSHKIKRSEVFLIREKGHWKKSQKSKPKTPCRM